MAMRLPERVDEKNQRQVYRAARRSGVVAASAAYKSGMPFYRRKRRSRDSPGFFG
jgi:hypothetical protein